MTSKEALEKISWRYVNEPSFQEWCNTIKQDLERLQELERIENETQELIIILENKNKEIKELRKENKELKEQHEKDFEIMCKQAYLLNSKHIDSPFIEKYQKAIRILKDFVALTKVRNEETNKWDIPIIYSLGLNKKLTQEEYELLKEVLENEK